MHVPEAVKDLEQDLAHLFGERLLSLVVYGSPLDRPGGLTPTLAVIEGLGTPDLAACAARVARWHDSGLATPLLLAPHEFPRALDVFPLEFGAILADHVVVAGTSPFTGARVDARHLRHACEVQARSHLLHLREGYVETGGRGDAIADLVNRSAEPLAALIRSVARLKGLTPDDLSTSVRDLERALGLTLPVFSAVVEQGGGRLPAADEARRLMAPYLEAAERLVRYLDRWPEA
jgi:hypothetical protein